MRCIVLGGAGFVGSRLVEHLVRLGHEVSCYGRSSTPSSTPANPAVRQWTGEFDEKAKLAEALEGQEVAYHLISTTIPSTSNRAPSFDVATNLVDTINFLEAARQQDLRKVVFASSGGTVYGLPVHVPIREDHPTNPISSYGIVKLAVEKYLHLYGAMYGLGHVSLRIANPYGETQRLERRQGVVGHFTQAALRDEPIEIWGDGSVVRDYFYVEDLVAALGLCATYNGPQRIMNIGSGQGASLNHLITMLESVMGRRVQRRYHPARAFDVPTNVLDVSLAARELGWRPLVPLEEGLRRVVEALGGPRQPLRSRLVSPRPGTHILSKANLIDDQSHG